MSSHDKQKYNQPIPPDWETYTLGFKVSGVHHRKDNVNVSLEDKNPNPNIIIVPEDDNEYDRNALRVEIKRKVFLWNTSFHIGYIPAELSAIVRRHDIHRIIKIRLRSVLRYESGEIVIICDLIGPSELYSDKLKKQIDQCEI